MTRFVLFNGVFILMMLAMQAMIPGFPWTISIFMVLANLLGYFEASTK